MLRNRKVLLAVGLLAAAAGAGLGIYRFPSGEKASEFRFTTVTQASLERVQAQANPARSDQSRSRALLNAGLVVGSALCETRAHAPSPG